MSGGKPYIGCRMGLLSKAENRYEGILYTIDTLNSTVVLAKVKCFGTEGRLTDRPTAPKDDIFDYIVFRGSDIKDIVLLERSPHYNGLPHDPAIVQSSSGSGLGLPRASCSPVRMAHSSHVPLPTPSFFNPPCAAAFGLGPVPPAPPGKKGRTAEKAVQTERVRKGLRQRKGVTVTRAPRQDPRKPRRTSAQSGSRSRERSGSPAEVQSAQGSGSAQPDAFKERTEEKGENGPPLRRRRGPRRHKNRRTGRFMGHAESSALKFDTDFDFDSSNAKFVKVERKMQDMLKTKGAKLKENGDQGDMHTKTMEGGAFGPKCFYDRTKSFFDNVPRNVSRWTQAEERRLNLETFGIPGRFVGGRVIRGRMQGQEAEMLTSQGARGKQK